MELADNQTAIQATERQEKKQSAVSLLSSGGWDPRSAGRWGEVTSRRGFSWAAGGDYPTYSGWLMAYVNQGSSSV
ncbi:hypothetical protein J7T55_005950 [Diaporthe amygdali]|uniref:uncharacterized protein n=1 Tax=Phomopsis amygdali TaxID=1214568 RepID=UPI0022FECFAA|nr:uncharacterized protein J7T55_005950 [Diaporthe amygdali]KAJ0124611.1 hypothetical protein J7T55_005950 [Diaporthe amygdali]